MNVVARAQLHEAPFQAIPPLSTRALPNRARTEPSLGHELSCEIASAHRVGVLSAFNTIGGVRADNEAPEDSTRRGARIRVLMPAFNGTTEVHALDELTRLPQETGVPSLQGEMPIRAYDDEMHGPVMTSKAHVLQAGRGS